MRMLCYRQFYSSMYGDHSLVARRSDITCCRLDDVNIDGPNESSALLADDDYCLTFLHDVNFRPSCSGFRFAALISSESSLC